MLETEIAAKLIDYLRSQEPDIWCEVPVPIFGETFRVDIVTVRPHNWLCAIEVKRKLDDNLVEQIYRWQGHANQCWACVEQPMHITKGHKYKADKLKGDGIGLYYIMPVMVQPQFQAASCTTRSDLILDQLCDSQRLSEAGVSGGKRVKKDAYDEVRAFLLDSGWPLDGKVIAVHMNWNPRERVKFVALASAGRLPGIKCNRNDVPFTFYVEER